MNSPQNDHVRVWLNSGILWGGLDAEKSWGHPFYVLWVLAYPPTVANVQYMYQAKIKRSLAMYRI